MDINVYQDGFLVFGTNFSSEFNHMWDRARIEDLLTSEKEVKISDALPRLLAALKEMKDHPEEFKPLEPKSKKRSYKDAVVWLENFVDACESSPNATYVCGYH